MAAWSSELQVHRIAFPLWVCFTLGFPTIFPTNTLNPRKAPRYVIKHTKTSRTSKPLQHKGLEVLSRHEWVRRKSSHGFLVRMRSAVRIRPAAPRYKETPPCRVVFFSLKRMPCFGRAPSQAVEKAAGFSRQPEEHHPDGWCSSFMVWRKFCASHTWKLVVYPAAGIR